MQSKAIQRVAAICLSLVAMLLAFAFTACGETFESDDGVAARAARQASIAADTLHARIVGESDLPPEDTRSLLDLWLAEQGAIPFPFARFVEALAAEDASTQPPLAVLVPDGRSLLKAEADFAAPRVVLAATARPPAGASIQPDFRGQIFLGFTENASEIELISYNESAGRFEFQLIKDYCEGCNPRLVYAKRAICTTCHQGGVPIFSVRPWEETNAQGVIANRIAETHPDQYQGVPVRVSLDTPDAIDNLTNQASVLVATQKAWLDGCGEQGSDCRREMLRTALHWITNPAALDGGAPILVSQQQKYWPAEGIALANNDLLSRNPFDAGLYEESVLAQVRRLLLGERERVASGDRIADFDKLPRLPPQFDPLSPRAPRKLLRATDLDAALGLALLFTANDRARLEAAAEYSPETLLAAVDRLEPTLFAPQPLQRTTLLQALMKALGQPAPAHRFADLGALSPAILEGEPPLELAADSPLIPFREYCFACHRGNPAARLNFMGGADEQTVLAKIRDTDKIRDALDWERYLGTRKDGQLMPPSDSWQRARLEQALVDADPSDNPLARMRDTVPSLFDF